MALNLHKAVTPILNALTPQFNINIKQFNNNAYMNGVTTPNYTTSRTTARVYLQDKQKLMHLNNINMSYIYKRFYINNTVLSGLNKALSTAGDFIILDNINYKIIEVLANHHAGWTCVIGCQGEPI